jgi:ribonuclease Z
MAALNIHSRPLDGPMPPARTFSEIRLVNGSTGDPALYIDYPGKDNALLFDAGENGSLDAKRLGDLEAVFLTHHHVDHFVGFDRIVRANLDTDKTLHVFGPPSTIQRVYARITSYELPYFPFMKIVFRVVEVHAGMLCTALLECARRFPAPVIEEQTWKGPVLYETDDLKVECVPVDHTAPCLAYALIEKPGYHADPVRLASGLLRPGRWVAAALERLRAGAPAEEVLEVQGGRFTLGQLSEQYFAVSRGARVAYVTDTAWSDASRPGLVKLARRAQRLYCDSYYSQAQAKQAVQHRHMTATAAAELARDARVEELILMHFAPRYAGRYQELVEEARTIFPRVTAEIS